MFSKLRKQKEKKEKAERKRKSNDKMFKIITKQDPYNYSEKLVDEVVDAHYSLFRSLGEPEDNKKDPIKDEFHNSNKIEEYPEDDYDLDIDMVAEVADFFDFL